MVDSVGIPVVDYSIAVRNHDRLLAQFQKTPEFARAVSYYRSTIGQVATVDDLLNDRRLLSVALSAFQLEGEVDSKGLLRKLLSQDPGEKGSLAQQLIDPRFRAFAQAFSSLRSDGGATVRDPAAINAVVAGFQTNEYEKWLSNKDGDPTLRQALFFKRTVEDTVSISTLGSLFTEFQNSADNGQAVGYYRDNIGKVTTVDGLLKDPKLLNVALAAFDIDPATVSSATLRQLLTTPPLTDPLIQDPRFAGFVQTFGSLARDGGAAIRQPAGIDGVIDAFEKAQFEKSVAAGAGTTNAPLAGDGGPSGIERLLGDFQRRSGVDQAIGYYTANIGKVSRIDDLLQDPQLLGVALSAFKIDRNAIAPALVRQLLTNDPSAPAGLAAQAQALVRQDPQYAAFAKAFGSLATDGGAAIHQADSVAAVTAAFQTELFRQSLVGQLQQATATPAAGHIAILQILSNPTLSAVTRGAVGLPDSVGGLAVDQQIDALTRAGFDPGKLSDPGFADTFVNRFLANAGLQQSGAGGLLDPGGLALALLSGDGAGTSADLAPPAFDLSFLGGAAGNAINLLV